MFKSLSKSFLHSLHTENPHHLSWLALESIKTEVMEGAEVAISHQKPEVLFLISLSAFEAYSEYSSLFICFCTDSLTLPLVCKVRFLACESRLTKENRTRSATLGSFPWLWGGQWRKEFNDLRVSRSDCFITSAIQESAREQLFLQSLPSSLAVHDMKLCALKQWRRSGRREEGEKH